MLKSVMDFFDVVFPLNVGPLSYRGPSNSAVPLMPGMLVRAEIRRSMKTGIVIGKAMNPPEGGLKEIYDIPFEHPVLSDSMLSLLKWISGYYIVPAGLALKSLLPLEVFETGSKGKKREGKKELPASQVSHFWPQAEPDANITDVIRESISVKEYKTCLFHAATTNHEISCVLSCVDGGCNTIILVPEIANIEALEPHLNTLFGVRLAILHGKLSKSQKKNAFDRIISGKSDIVLGTRLAVFAPLKSVSLIAVTHEHSRSYKNMEGLRYNARDVAVMRGYLDKATVLLSSPSPSIESFYNTIKGKYKVIRSDARVQRPRVEIINMKATRKISPYLSKRSVDAAKASVKRKEGALFLINRKGYAVIQCAECDCIEICPECSVPLVFHKDARLMKCHCCGHKGAPPETCRRCGSASLEMIGAGTQRIASDIKDVLGIDPIRADRDISRSALLEGFSGETQKEGMIVGTKIITKRLMPKESLGLCIFLNPDAGLNFPDFRSSELLFQELHELSECLTRSGLLIIQTRMPENFVYRAFKKYDYRFFFEEELSRRRSMLYPPFSRLALISVSSKFDIEKDISEAMKKAGTGFDKSFEIIGPVKAADKGMNKWKILLKSPAKVRLHLYVHNLLKNLGDKKKLKIVVDVDPISI